MTIFVCIISVTFGQIDDKSKKDICFQIPDELSPRNGTKLFVSVLCEIKNFEFKLYDKWGVLLYSTTSISSPFDLDISEKIKVRGKEKEKYPTGIYVWSAKYQVTLEDKLIEKSLIGNLTIKH